ncbi:MAG: CerR family C-terminal domain-containing protein, partial [Planctomycetaceae bacterium]|nr:CerR family C-terminal domain-containing protein [Planctomycetaceae bacterium]
NAAGEVFAALGYEKATVREICRRADANLAALNYHFGDKKSVYLEAVKQAHCEGADSPTWQFPAEIPAEQKLYLFIEKMMEDMLDRESPSWHLELMMREMARPTEACAELVHSFIAPKFALLLGVIDELVPDDVPLSKRHLLAFSVVGQCLLYRFHRPFGQLLIGDDEFESLFDVPYLARHICDLSVHGIRETAQQWRGEQ